MARRIKTVLALTAAILFLTAFYWIFTPRDNLSAFDLARDWAPFQADDNVLLPKYPANNARSVQHEAILSQSCWSEFISQRTICDLAAENLEQVKLDLVYTYQDGDDPLQSQARSKARKGVKGKVGFLARHFRTHDELKYSLRSFKKAFANHTNALEKITIFTADLIDPRTKLPIKYIPRFLNRSHPFDQHIRVHVEAPSNGFKSSAFQSERQARNWRKRSLPVFNSMAVESQLCNLNTSDNWIYLNDDWLFGQSLSPLDFFSPLFGSVFRLQLDLHVESKDPSTYRSNSRQGEGEWPSLRYSNWLIDQRFGAQRRAYPVHHAKVFNRAILQEVEQVWSEEITKTASMRFRGSDGYEVNMAFLYINHVIERHREVLLWSLIVLKTDVDGDGTLSTTELENLIASLPPLDSLEQGSRTSSELETDLKTAGLGLPVATQYNHSSYDGYPYLPLPFSKPLRQLEPLISTFSDQPAVLFFKHVAFEQRHLGSLLVQLLAQQTRGLATFLPSEATTFDVSFEEWTRILPLTKDWRTADFSRHAILGDLSEDGARAAVVRMLVRYSYCLGETPFRFIRLSQIAAVHKQLDPYLREPNKLPALLVLNDDYGTNVDGVDGYLAAWFHQLWPDQADWEL